MSNGLNGKRWKVILPAGVLIAVVLAAVAGGRQYGADQQRLEDTIKRVDVMELDHAKTLVKISTDIAMMKTDIKWIKKAIDDAKQ